ncbi:MAG: hypothetical protein GY934_19600 [Gammaproteobacteria bacterium]|nr:hypothetical protein [Gammaproteobacteria bacterium]
MKKNVFPGAMIVALIVVCSTNAGADSTQARCDIYPRGDDKAAYIGPCVFSQRQGYVNITLPDGTDYDLSPTGDQPGNYLDQNGKVAYRQSGFGKNG